LAWWLAGALFHIGADLMTIGGVPLLLPHWRVHLGVLRTGGTGEYVVVLLFVVAALVQVVPLPVLRLAMP